MRGEEWGAWKGEWVLLFRIDAVLCLSVGVFGVVVVVVWWGAQNVPARAPLKLNGSGRWIIPCAALSLDKFKGSPTTRHHGKKVGGRWVVRIPPFAPPPHFPSFWAGFLCKGSRFHSSLRTLTPVHTDEFLLKLEKLTLLLLVLPHQ